MAGHNSPEVSCGTPQFAKQLVWCSVFRRCLGDFFINGCVAQLVRALRSHRRGRWFKSNHIHQIYLSALPPPGVFFYKKTCVPTHVQKQQFFYTKNICNINTLICIQTIKQTNVCFIVDLRLQKWRKSAIFVFDKVV